MSRSSCKYRIGYALNPKKLRKSENSEKETDSKESKGKPSKLWRGGGLADILESQSDDEDSGSIAFQSWDYRVSLENQPHFDLIIHKLTEDLSRETEESRDKLASLEKYLLHYPKTVIVDPIDCVEKVTSRARTVDCLAAIQSNLGPHCPFHQPNYLVLDEPTSSNEVLQLMESRKMHFPVICKPVEACGKPRSHQMVVIVAAEDLSLLMFPCVLQQYHSHAQRLFKVYVIAEEVMVALRPSLPDLSLNELQQNIYQSVAFDSRYCYPTQEQFLRTPPPAAPNSPPALPHAKDHANSWKIGLQSPSSSSSCRPTNPTACLANKSDCSESESSHLLAEYEEVFRAAARVIREHFGLTLFGFDVILPHHSLGNKKEILVIDVNFFPSYKEVPDFPARLKRYLRQRIESNSAGTSACDSNDVSVTR